MAESNRKNIERDPVEIAVVVEIIFERNSCMRYNSYSITALITAYLNTSSSTLLERRQQIETGKK